MRVNDTSGYHVYGWMRNILHLTGGELATYAIVHQFSQSKAGLYKGGVPYIADWIGCSLPTARKYLHSLESKGLIRSDAGELNGVPFRNYQVVDNHIPKKFEDTPKKFEGDPKEILGGTLKNFEGEKNIEENINNNLSIGESAPHKKSRFTPPTLQEVTDYCNERNNTVPPQDFIDFYESKGWMIGKSPMKDWKAAVRTWEHSRRDERPKAPRKTRLIPPEEMINNI